MNNQTPPTTTPPHNENIRGEPLTEDVMRLFAEVDATDLENAAMWWDTNAPDEWRGALDAVPTDE